MTDLERFFRRLVDNLIAIDPARLHRPVELAEIAQTIVPYRTNRRALELESNEDYDMVLLRLCAGEGGFVRTDPPDVQGAFATQAASPNPDLSVLRDFSATGLILATEQLAYALGPEPGMAYAPPEEDDLSPPAASDRSIIALDSVRWTRSTIEPVAPFELPEEEATGIGTPVERSGRCGYCGGSLPTNRTVNFCPHCGESQSLTRCPTCQGEVELGWKHCVTCGAPMVEP
ncbi:MAG: zinc ribbon domain-containing protein [Gemmatimonadota bacterium]